MDRHDSTKLPAGVQRLTCSVCFDLYFLAGPPPDERQLCSACRRTQPMLEALIQIGLLLQKILDRPR